jgi:hypothetical protein
MWAVERTRICWTNRFIVMLSMANDRRGRRRLNLLSLNFECVIINQNQTPPEARQEQNLLLGIQY